VAGDQVLPAAIAIVPSNGPVATMTPAASSPGRSSQNFQQVLRSLGTASLPADSPAVTAGQTGGPGIGDTQPAAPGDTALTAPGDTALTAGDGMPVVSSDATSAVSGDATPAVPAGAALVQQAK
jgi:hypothetical protein